MHGLTWAEAQGPTEFEGLSFWGHDELKKSHCFVTCQVFCLSARLWLLIRVTHVALWPMGSPIRMGIASFGVCPSMIE